MTHTIAPFQLRRLLALCCFTALALLASPTAAQAQSQASPDLGTLDRQTAAANDRLLAALRALQAAPAELREARSRALVSAAAQRKEQLLQLLDRDPGRAALRLLPEPLRARMPAAAALETPARVSGQLVVQVAEDPAHGVVSHRVLVQGAAGQPVRELHLADPRAGEHVLFAWAGKRVDVNALQLGNHLIMRLATRLLAQAARAASPAPSRSPWRCR